ncbi:MAG: S9 family peptidase [Cyclonatronaceae bacterium]
MKKSILPTILFALILAVCSTPLSAAIESDQHGNGNDADELWSPEYMVENFKRVGGTEISPDGQWIAFTVSESRTGDEHSDYLTHIHLVKSDGSRQFQLTRGEESASSPQWSPDGRYISFTSSRGGDGNQLWMIDPKGGEAWQVTEAEGSIDRYQWSHSGDRIAFTMVDPPSEEDKARQRERRDVNVVDEDLRYAHLYTVTVDPGQAKPDDIQRLTEGEFHVGSFDWSPDDAALAFDHQPRPGTEYWPQTNISTVPSDSGSVELLIDLGGKDARPLYSPDGRHLAFISDQGVPRWPGYDVIMVKNLDDGSVSQPGETFDDRPMLLEWSPDGSHIYYMERHKTSMDLFAMPASGGEYRQITEGDGMFFGISLSADESTLAAIHQDFAVSPDVIISDAGSFNPRRLTRINEGYEQTEIARAEVISYESPDGMEIEAVLIYPLDYEEGKRYPVLLHVHGGPTGVFGESYVAFPGVYPLQKFAAEGYFILRPNFRGSGGYGREFRFANISDWGFGDLEDMEAGLDLLIEQGKADPDRQGIMGWSYGGFMSSFAITRTDRFKASMVGAGVTNLVSFVGTADIPSFLPDYFEGDYWENYERFKRHSAIFNVENIRTPTLIMHPEEDIRVPPSQGYELYIALDRMGVDTKMVTYPRQPHGLREPKFIIDAAERQLEWLEEYVK